MEKPLVRVPAHEGISISGQMNPCACGPQHIIDHSEFGLPLGCNRRCDKCGKIWFEDNNVNIKDIHE